MSNHSGSYMLKNVLNTAMDMDIFEIIGKEKTVEFVLALVNIGRGYDCNDDEILGDIAEDLGICYRCLKPSDNLKYGACENCRDEDEDEE